MRIPRVACVNDLSGFGRCSLTTAIAVISASGVQPCPVPTAILSKHTQFPAYYFHDLTENIPPYLESWSDIDFDGIYSGFLGSPEQIDITKSFITDYRKKNPNGKIIIDPVMGDKGRLYATYTMEMCRKIKGLISHAHIITPNITEACFLTDTPYTGENISHSKAIEMMKKLSAMGCSRIVLTGVDKEDSMINMIYDKGSFSFDSIKREKQIFSGTGDLFSSVICAMILKGKTLKESVCVAGKFISSSLEYTISAGTPLSEGVIFEPCLYTLAQQ